MHRAALAREVVNHQPSNVLRTAGSRKKFGRELCEALQFWSFEEMQSFVEEMRGLNFRLVEDRQLFVQFLSSWIGIGDRT